MAAPLEQNGHSWRRCARRAIESCLDTLIIRAEWPLLAPTRTYSDRIAPRSRQMRAYTDRIVHRCIQMHAYTDRISHPSPQMHACSRSAQSKCAVEVRSHIEVRSRSVQSHAQSHRSAQSHAQSRCAVQVRSPSAQSKYAVASKCPVACAVEVRSRMCSRSAQWHRRAQSQAQSIATEGHQSQSKRLVSAA